MNGVVGNYYRVGEAFGRGVNRIVMSADLTHRTVRIALVLVESVIGGLIGCFAHHATDHLLVLVPPVYRRGNKEIQQ